MKIGYARVSTRDQKADLQVDALKQAGCERIYQDIASGAKSARPELDKLLANVRPGDAVVIWKLDRLGRSGARQDSCHLSHAAKGCLFVLPIATATTDSRSGLSVTGPAGDQFRVWRDQRAGWRSRASAYSAWRAARMA